jgi:hypothetical protein
MWNKNNTQTLFYQVAKRLNAWAGRYVVISPSKWNRYPYLYTDVVLSYMSAAAKSFPSEINTGNLITLSKYMLWVH